MSPEPIEVCDGLMVSDFVPVLQLASPHATPVAGTGSGGGCAYWQVAVVGEAELSTGDFNTEEVGGAHARKGPDHVKKEQDDPPRVL